jgi:16S rRNA (guanine966-N2)-methyltransferase
MSIRLTGGFAKGMTVLTPPGSTTRPTGAKVRQAIWNSLMSELPLAMLDVFSGSGSMGLEGLSRGVGRVVFVEADRRAASVIAKNIEELKRRGKAQGIDFGDAQLIRKPLENSYSQIDVRFDLIYMDPPYDMIPVHGHDWLVALSKSLSIDGKIILESRRGLDSHAICPSSLQVLKNKAYGDTLITYLGWQHKEG